MPPLFYYDASGITQIAGKAAFANDWAVASAAGSRELARQESDYALAYATCVWAFRGINIRAQRVASLLYRWGRVVDKATGKAVDNHPLQAALDLVYRTYRQDLFEEWQISKCLYGEAYIEKVNAEVAGIRLHLPLTFRLLNALGVEPRIQRGAIVGYDYQDDAGSVAFTPEQIAFDKAYNPLDDNRGLSLLAAALDAVNVDRQLLILTRANLRNNMRPGIIFTPRNGAITPTDEGQIKAAIEERGKGATNAGRPLFMPIPMDVTTVNPPSFEDQDTLNEQQKRRIAAAVGVPVGLIDHTDQAFQLSPEQKRALYELTLLPAAEKMARIVDIDLLPFVDNSGRCRYELASEEVLASVEDAGAVAARTGEQFRSGYITFNEARQRQALPAVDGGDWYAVPTGIVPVPAAQIGQVGQLVRDAQPAPAPSFPALMSAAPAEPLPPVDAKPSLPTGVIVGKVAQSDADNELRTWQKFALKHGAVKALRFETYAVDALTAAYIRLALEDGAADAEAVRTVFSDAALVTKAYADTRAAFRDEIVTYIRQGQQQETDRRAFAAKLRAALRRFGLLAFRDGFNDGGADPESYGADELAAFRDWQARQSEYVSHFGAELFKDGITELEVSTRADMWANKSLGEIYHEGLALAAPNKPFRWQRNPRKDSCTDCIALDGQIKPMKDWKASIMPQSDKLECRGFDCGCKLVSV